MLRYGYDRRLASGVIAASGTLAQIDPAVAGADRAGRPARPLGRRHVSRRLHARLAADRPVRDLRARRHRSSSRRGCRRCRPRRASIREDSGASGLARWSCWWRSAAAAAFACRRVVSRRGHRELRAPTSCGPGAAGRDRLAFVLAMVNRLSAAQAAVAHGRARDLRADPAAGADLPGAGHDLPRHRHADRRRRDGRDGRADHGAGAQPADRSACSSRRWTPPPSCRASWCSS